MRTYKTELREGYAYLAHTRLLAAVVLMVMFMNGIDQGWNAVLLPVHAERNLGGAAELGLVTAAFGAGGLLGALLYGAVGHRFRRRTVLAVAVLLCGAPRFTVAGLTGLDGGARRRHGRGGGGGRDDQPDPDDGDVRDASPTDSAAGWPAR